MSGTTGSSQDLGDKLATPPPAQSGQAAPHGQTAPQSEAAPRTGPAQPTEPAPPPAPPEALTRFLAGAAVTGIVTSLLIMIAASVIRNNWEHPWIMLPVGGPPWGLSVHVKLLPVVTVAMWAAALLGGGGVAAGLAALARGARPPVRLLVAVGITAAALFTVLPPTGSTDAIDYAAYGRMVVRGDSPYVMTPAQLRRTGDPVGKAIPSQWRKHVAVYGPLASAEQWAAAEIGGASVARIDFWLKLWTTIAFGAVALALDRLTRSDRAQRTRAHLLWTANPLLLWVLVAAGHVDMVAAAAGFLGLLVMRSPRPGEEPGALRGLAAGLLVGMAADIKITYLIFGVGLAWASRRSVAAFLSAGVGGALVLFPTYLWFGSPAAKALVERDASASVDNYYQIFVGSHGNVFPHQLLLAGALSVAVAALLLWKLPDGVPALPAVRPAFAVALAWLFIWPYQLPWYDAMVFCLIALYPASRLDWLLLARLTAATFALMPGNAGFPAQHLLAVITSDSLYWLAPAVLFAAAVALVWLGLTDRWNMGPPVLTRLAGRSLRG
jgi:hypothetical protein